MASAAITTRIIQGRQELSSPRSEGDPACTFDSPGGTGGTFAFPLDVVEVAVVVGVVAVAAPGPAGWPTVASA
jgi:hypothetical protein